MQFRIAHALIMRRVHFSTFNAEAGGHPQNSRFAAHGRPCANYVRNSSTHTQRFVRIKWVRVGIREGISMPLSESCIKAAAVSKVRFVGVACEDYAGRVGVRSAHIRMRGLRPPSN